MREDTKKLLCNACATEMWFLIVLLDGPRTELGKVQMTCENQILIWEQRVKAFFLKWIFSSENENLNFPVNILDCIAELKTFLRSHIKFLS